MYMNKKDFLLIKKEIKDPCLVCGLESEYVGHGFTDGEVYSNYYCHKHFYSEVKNSGRKKKCD